jgi:hypothetical protein
VTTPAQPETPATGPGTPATGEQTPEPTTPVTAETQQPATGEDGTDWKKYARDWERKSKDNVKKLSEYEQQLNTLKKALGLEGEDDLPEHAKAKLSEAEKRAEEAETRAMELAYESTVSRIAATVNADAEALLDSDSFRNAVGEELGEDFDDDDMRKAVVKVAKEFAKKPRFAKSQGSPRSGADFTGAPSAPPNIDQAIADAEKAGNFSDAIAMKRRRRAG